MKHFILIAMLASLFTGFAFAEETSTECPMMKELNERNNPKANLEIKSKVQKPKSSSTAQ